MPDEKNSWQRTEKRISRDLYSSYIIGMIKSNLDNFEYGEGEGGAPEDPPGGGEVALVDNASVSARVLKVMKKVV